MAPRRGTKQTATEQIVVAAANSNVSPLKRKKSTAKTIAKKKQVKAGTRHAKAADKHENEMTDNEAAGPAKELRSRAKKVVMVSPKSRAKTVKNNTKNRFRKVNEQEIKTDTECDAVLQITEKKTRTKATTILKKAGSTKKSPVKSKTTLLAAKRSKKKTAIENGAGDAENANDEEPSKNTRRRKALEENVALVATKSKTSRKRKNEDTKNIENEQIEKKQQIQPINKKSRRANKIETEAANVKIDQDTKVVKSKEKVKKTAAKKVGVAKPEASIEKKVKREEESSQSAALHEDNLEEKSIKKTVIRRKPNIATEVTEPKSKKRKANPSMNKKDETKTRQKKEQTTAEEDEIITDAIMNNEISIKEDSTLELIDDSDAKDNDPSGTDNINSNKEDSPNKDVSDIKSHLTEIERSATFLCL